MRAAAPTQFINRKGLSQSGFTENVRKFSRALNQNLTRASLENNSGKDLICQLVYHHLSRWEDFAWKNSISNTSKIEVAHSYVPLISTIPCSSTQKIACPSYLYCNFHKRGSLELCEKFTKYQLGGECSHRTLPFNQADANTLNYFDIWKQKS